MEYDPTQFRGTAPYYRRGRPPYSAQLGEVLARELGLDGRGRLLDVGCGPGTVGVALAPWFAHVTFADPDAEMLAEARAHAAAAGLGLGRGRGRGRGLGRGRGRGPVAADFLASTAEDLPGAGLPPVRVVTFGQSFHRTDRVRTAEGVHDLLEPGGSLVLVVHDPLRPAPAAPPDTSPVPHSEIRDLVRAFLGPQLRSGARPASSYGDEPFELTLARTRFGPPRVVHAPGRPDLVRDVDGVVANYLSMSFAAPPLFGSRLPEFVASLRRLLEGHAPNGRFWDWPGDTALFIATRR